jgi:hypothetical protein
MDKGSKTLNVPLKSINALQGRPLEYVVYGTIKGSIGAVAFLPESIYELLEDLQSAILQDIPKGFGSDYVRWRSYRVICLKFC